MINLCLIVINYNFNCVIKVSLELVNWFFIDILINNVKDVDFFNKIKLCLFLLFGRNEL